MALRGHDVVAYHAGTPKKGDAAHAVAFNGSKFLFATAENQRAESNWPEVSKTKPRD